MKRGLAVWMALALFWACQSKMEGPIRTIENGVEVVDNGTGIYAVPGQPSSLSLREEFRIDLEDEALAEAGLNDIVAVDADSKGRIFLFRQGFNAGPTVFRFDEQGRFAASMCPIGQGPGEVEYPHFIPISAADEIRVFSQGANKLMVFDGDGHLLFQRPVPSPVEERRFLPARYKPLADGGFLAQLATRAGNGEFSKITVCLLGQDFRIRKEIRDYVLPGQRNSLHDWLRYVPIVGVCPSGFFVNWGSEGRDVAVFDLDGRLTRIIKAELPMPSIPGEYKDWILAQTPEGLCQSTSLRVFLFSADPVLCQA